MIYKTPLYSLCDMIAELLPQTLSHLLEEKIELIFAAERCIAVWKNVLRSKYTELYQLSQYCDKEWDAAVLYTAGAPQNR